MMGSGRAWRVLLLVALATAVGCSARAAPRVSVGAGVLVGTSQAGVDAFKGIPYGAPPVGELRWAPPAPAAAWTGERQATAYGPICPQPRRPDAAAVAGGDRAQSEDCLSLNVWAPRGVRGAPVMVWIHGGAFRFGSGGSPIYDGTSFAREGVVFVSINYRLGALGFFAHPALTRAAPAGAPLGAYGLMDQIAALRWVRDNIAAFGGDPANVTVAGESAGGESVLFLMTTPAARGLFAKAIVESGGGWAPTRTLAQEEAAGAELATKAGLPGADATLAQLRAMTIEQTLATPMSLGGLGPFEDGRLVPENPSRAFADGHAAAVPLLIGSNSYEASLMTAFHIPAATIAQRAGPGVRAAYGNDAKDDATLGPALFTDIVMGAPARWIAGQASRRAPAYLYHFAYVSSLRRAPSPGAGHGSEIPFALGTGGALVAQMGLPFTEPDAAMQSLMHGCWVSFVKTGAPQCGGAAWPAYDPARGEVMLFGPRLGVVEHFRQTQYDALERASLPTLGLARR